MSSRAAAGRKRLAPGAEPPRSSTPKASKGFFSRSKSATASTPQLDLAAQYPPAQPPKGALLATNREPNGLGKYRVSDARPDLVSADRPRPAQYGQSPAPSLRKVTSGATLVSAAPAYSFPTQKEPVSRHIIQLNAPGPRGNGLNEYEEEPGITYFEASYQPPPPIQASYQPPPPTARNSANGQRSLPNVPGKREASAFDTVSAYPTSPNYPEPSPPSSQFSLPSPFPSPRQTPSHLRRISPTPTELPTYSSSGHENYSPSQFDQSPLHIPIYSPHARQEYVQYQNSSPYPSPPSSQPSRLTPSPLPRLHLSNQAASFHSIENDPRHLWYRGGDGGQGSESPILSPARGFHLSPPPSIMSPRSYSNRPPESVSGSSDYSGSGQSKSPSLNESVTTPATPAFVFPGSRSVAKPKVSSKTNTPVIKLKGRGKSRIRSDSDVVPPTVPIPPTPALNATYQPPPTAGSVGSDGFVFLDPHSRSPIAGGANHTESISDGSSAFSDDSDFGSSSYRVHNGSTRGSANAGSSNAGGSNTGSSNNGSSTTGSLKSGSANAGSVKSGSSGGTTAAKPQIFPAGRSRAQPSKVPQGIKLKSLTPRARKTSSNSNEGGGEERSRFMGLLKKKKKKLKIPESIQGSSAVSPGSDGDSYSSQAPTPSADSSYSFEDSQNVTHVESSRDRASRIKSRIGSYPLDPYDSVLLDNDRHTGELLVRLNPTGSPSFHNYGNSPPTSVLDLGCGQGHWVVDAAIAWKGYGTKVTGYDMVDISKGLLPWAAEQDVVDNVRFFRGNFLKQRLPFSDNSFDLVRMSCLALCITSNSWVFVLQEVSRVLEVGGRLELIDDLIFFPYGKVAAALDQSRPAQIESVAPKLDITIPSSSFSTFNIYDENTTNPGLGTSIMEDDPEDFYDLYGVEEEETELDDTATLNGREGQFTPVYAPSSRTTPQPKRGDGYGISSRSWNRAFATSGDLEALFEHMLVHKFSITKDPSDFILDLMQEVFGHAREVKTMNLTLAPPEPDYGAEAGVLAGSRGPNLRSSPQVRRESMGLSQSPGLVLWPSTFIPMDQSEIEIHASKHLRMLLSCKNFLIEHALEATDDEEIDESSVLEALWEYEGFLRHRFNPPSPSPGSSLSGRISRESSDNASIRGSIAESVSSDGLEAMWEIQSEFRQRFAWQRSGSTDSPTPSTSSTPDLSHNANAPPSSASTSSAPPSSTPSQPPNPPSATQQIDSDRLNALSLNPAPIYSRDELTHVRTFRIYEAIKLDESIFGTAM